MKNFLLVTSFFVSLIYFTDAHAERHYSSDNLVISSGSYTKSNIEVGAMDYDKHGNWAGYNYNNIEINGGKLSLSDFGIHSATDVIIRDGEIVLTNGEISADGLYDGYYIEDKKGGYIVFYGGVTKATSSELYADCISIGMSSKYNAVINLDGSDLIARDSLWVYSKATINATNGSNIGVDGTSLDINGGTINLTDSAIYATPENSNDKPVISIYGGTINMKGDSYIVSNTMEDFGDYERYTAGEGHIYGGTINVTAGENGIVMDAPEMSGTLNIAKGTTFSVWENYDDDDETLEFYNKGTLNTTIANYYGSNTPRNGIINLSGGKLQANVIGGGTVNVKAAGSVIDGDFDGLNLQISANTTLSQLITGNIHSIGSVYLQNGILTIDRLPENKDGENPALKSFRMEQGTLKGIGVATNGAIDILGGTVNVSDGIYLSDASNKYGEGNASMNLSGANITVTGNSDDNEGGEINLIGNGNMNFSGTNTVVNMNYSNKSNRRNHDGGILHEGRNGDINISGGTFNLTGKVAKIERGGFDGDWIYTQDGAALFAGDDYYAELQNGMMTTQRLRELSGNEKVTMEDIDYDQYHVSEGDINISGGTINLKEGARISNTYKNTGDINITGGTIKSIKTSNNSYEGDYGRIQHYGSGDLNISGNAVIEMERGDIKKGNHGDNDERTSGDVNIGENAKITLYNDSHFNADQNISVTGGTINLYNNATLEGYGNFNVSGGNITVGRMTDKPSDDDEVWSAIGSNYKDGNVTITGGNITLNNNAALDRSVHIDEDMDIGQLGGIISGDINILGGKVTANGNSIILLGWGDGEDTNGNDLQDMIDAGTVREEGNIVIGGNAEVTLNDNATIIHDVNGRVLINGGTVNLNGNSAIKAEHNGVVEISGGELNLDGQAKIYADNSLPRSADINVSESALINAKGNNFINNNIALSDSELKVASGAELTIEKKYNDGLISMSDGASVDIEGTLNANISGDGSSTVSFRGSNAVLNGSANDLDALEFYNAKTTFENQNLTANSINLSGSTLTFNGDVLMQSLDSDITLEKGSLIRVAGGDNTITSAHDIILNDSNLEIKNGASLDLNVGNDGHVEFHGGNIYLLGKLTGNIYADNVSIDKNAILERGMYKTAEIIGKTGNVSAFITDKIDVGDLNITSRSNITLDKANTLVVSEEENRKYVYWYGKYNGKYYTELSDQNDYESDGEIDYDEIDDDEKVRNYENQINGTLTVNGNSTLTLKTNLAADRFVIDGGSTLNAQNQIIGGKSLLVDNGSTANLQHTNPYIYNESGFSDSIVVDNGSTLNVTDLDIGSSYQMTGDVEILNGSTLNFIDDGFHASTLFVVDSTVKAKEADFGAKYNNEKPSTVFENSYLDMDSSISYTHGIAGLYDGSRAVLKNNSDFAANGMEIINSTVEANNSHIGAFKDAVNIDVEDGAIYNNINHGLFLNDQTDLNVDNSVITLNGNSELGVSMAITESDGRDRIIGHLTPEMLENPELLRQLKSKYRGYKMVSHQNYDEDHNYDFDDDFQQADEYKANVYIVGSNITLNDNAKIINAMLNNKRGSGDVHILSYSTVNVNGNNTISAAGGVNVDNSTINVNKGAELNVETLTIGSDPERADGRDFYLSNSMLNLRGTLNADIVGDDVSTLWITGDATFNGDAENLGTVSFKDSATTLKNQNLSANNIALDGSVVNIKGGVSLSANDSLSLSNNSTLNVNGLNNSIYGGNLIDLTNSVINIKRNSQLNFNLGNNGEVRLNNGYINIYEGSELSGNITAVQRVTLNGGDFNYLTGPDVQEYDVNTTSNIINGKFTNLGDLVIANNKGLTIDKDGMFVISQDDIDYARPYATGTYNRKKYYVDAVDLYEDDDDDDDEDSDEEVRNYENQILGTLEINNSNVTSKTNFAAKDVKISNSTFNITDKILGGSTLEINNGSKVNLLNKNAYALSGFDEEVRVEGGSSLTTGHFQVGLDYITSDDEKPTKFYVTDNSTYTITNGEFYAGDVNVLYNSILNATNSRVKAIANEMNFDGSTLNASGSFVQSDKDLAITKNGDTVSVINLKAKSTLITEENMAIYDSKVIADNSDIGAFKHAVKIDVEDREVNNKIDNSYWKSDGYDDSYEPAKIIMSVKDSDITLKGNSRFGTGLAITNWKSGTQGVIEGFITRDLFDNPEDFLNDRRFAKYDIDDDFENGFDDAINYQGYLAIEGSSIVMDGTSTIINASLNTDNSSVSGAGDILIDSSSIEVKGNNTVISAAHDIKLTDSELHILRGAVLNIASDTANDEAGKDIYLNGTQLDLMGTIKGNVIFTDNDSNEFIMNGGHVEGKVIGLSNLSFGSGQSGNTSKTMKGMEFEDINNLTIAGTTVNGKTSAPKITLDSSIFTTNDEVNKRYYAYDKKAKGYINLGTWENVAQYYDGDNRYDVKAFDNQISGKVKIENGASLTVNSALAANGFELDNKATLIANNARIDGDLSLNNNSTATINGNRTSDVSMGIIELSDSTLNLNGIDWMGIHSLSAENSKLNLSNGTDLDPYAGVDLTNTTTNLSSSCMWERDNAEKRILAVEGGILNATASQIGFFDTSIADAKATASKGSFWAVGNADISGSEITLNDTVKMATGYFEAEEYAGAELYEHSEEFKNRYEENSINMKFSKASKLNLNGTSAVALAIYGNIDVDLKGNILFDQSEVNMNGKSGISNNAVAVYADEYSDDESGSILFDGNSVLNIKGKDNSLSATNFVGMVGSTLNINKGSTLNVKSYITDEDFDDTLYVANSVINLSGVLNANLWVEDDEENENKTIFNMNGGRVNGVVKGLDNVSLSAGQSGNTSKTMKGMEFEDINNLTIAGTTVNGKTSAPKITLDSSIFTVSNSPRQYVTYLDGKQYIKEDYYHPTASEFDDNFGNSGGDDSGNATIDDWKDGGTAECDMDTGECVWGDEEDGGNTGNNSNDNNSGNNNSGNSGGNNSGNATIDDWEDGGTAECDEDGCVYIEPKGISNNRGIPTSDNDWNNDEPDYGELKDYENQVLGNVEISNKATLTVNNALAATNINVDNATLISNNGLLAGNLNIDNNAVATINGALLDGLVLGDIDIKHDSTLNLNSVEYMEADSIKADSSTLNLNKWTELSTARIDLESTKTTISAGGAWVHAYDAGIYGGSFNMADADVRFVNSVFEDSDITISKNALMGIGSADITSGKITVNDNSKLTTGFLESQNLYDHNFYGDQVANMLFNGATLNLNGNSALEMAIVLKADTDSGRSKNDGYYNDGLKGNIIFDDETVVNMNGKSSINNLSEASGYGDITFKNGSALTVRGKNNTLYAEGNISFDNSTLDVGKGARLTSDNTILLNNARLKWIGTIDADMSGTVNTLILSTVRPSEHNVNISGITSFGISGISKKADIDKAFGIYRAMGGSANVDTFEITDKSNFTYDYNTDMNFNSLNVENSSLTIGKGAGGINLLSSTNGSNIKVLAGVNLDTDRIDIEDSSFTVSGKAKGRYDTEYADEISATSGIKIDNTYNTKAVVNITNTNIISNMDVFSTSNTTIRNAKVSGDLMVDNYDVKKSSLTLNNVEFLGDLSIFDTTTANLNTVDTGNIIFEAEQVSQDKKGNNIYNTATLSNVYAGTLTLNNTKAVLQKNNDFGSINVLGSGYLDVKDSLSSVLNLTGTSVTTLANNKWLTGNVNMSDDALFNLQGVVNGSVNVEGGILNISGNNARVLGDVNGADLRFTGVKNGLNKFFNGNVSDVGVTELKNSTLTADKNNFSFGKLSLEKSSLIISDDIISQASNLYVNASTINLGIGRLTINGDAMFTNKSNIALRVDDEDTYGQLKVNGKLVLDTDAKGKPTTNLSVTLDRKISLDVSGGKTYSFEFLDYEDREGNLNNVTIANNRYAFIEDEVGHFTVKEKTKADKAITRYDVKKVNAARAAAALIDDGAGLTSSQQISLSSGLNDLSQVVGGEDEYIQALEASNPDDNNMVSENTINTVETALSGAKERTSSGGISTSAEGMASGDTPSGVSLWTKILHNRSKLDANDTYSGFKSKSNGLAMGADKMVSSNMKLGIGYAYTDGNIKNPNRKTDVDTHTIMFYSEYKPSDFFIDAFASYGWSKYKSRAYSVLGTTKSDFDVYAAQMQANVGYDIHVDDDIILTPMTGLRYINITQDDYIDSDDKRIEKSHNDIVTLLAGVKLKKSYEVNRNTIIVPEARLGINYDLVRDNNGSVVRLSDGSSYVVDGRTFKRFAVETGLGLTAMFDDNWEIGAAYEGSFRKDYRDHTGLLNLKYKF